MQEAAMGTSKGLGEGWGGGPEATKIMSEPKLDDKGKGKEKEVVCEETLQKGED